MSSPEKKEPQSSTNFPTWHDPEELRDRLNQPATTLEEKQAQTRRMNNPALNATPAALPKKKP